jgi:Sec-independent protein translocase protein TatA
MSKNRTAENIGRTAGNIARDARKAFRAVKEAPKTGTAYDKNRKVAGEAVGKAITRIKKALDQRKGK